MDPEELSAWIDHWGSKYPEGYDVQFATFANRESLEPDDLEILYQWKFNRLWPARKIRAMREFPEGHIRELTQRAFKCDDPMGALLILGQIPGLQAAGASAVLAAQSPDRYTVMDVRAIASLAGLDLWDTAAQGSDASAIHWPAYLSTCHRIARDTGRSLRAVDRALYKANGAGT